MTSAHRRFTTKEARNCCKMADVNLSFIKIFREQILEQSVVGVSNVILIIS
jgi:hypothetical protein